MLVVVSKTATGRSRRTTIMRCNKMSVAAAAICESANLRLPSLLYIHCFAVVVVIIFFTIVFGQLANVCPSIYACNGKRLRAHCNYAFGFSLPKGLSVVCRAAADAATNNARLAASTSTCARR